MEQSGKLIIKRLDKLQKKVLKGSFQANTPVPSDSPTCSQCRDRGVIIEGEKAYQCGCMKQKAIINKFKYANIGRHLRHLTFSQFKFKYYSSVLQDEKHQTYREIAQCAYNAAQEFVSKCLQNRHVRGLLFTGPVGSGKTFIASAIANELLGVGKVVLFVVVPDFLDQLKSTYDQFMAPISELQLLDSARNAEILILDDLGAHNYTEWTRNKIYTIINYRLNNDLPTVITTNLELEGLEEYLGERTTSRLLQLCKIYRLLVEDDIRYQESLNERDN